MLNQEKKGDIIEMQEFVWNVKRTGDIVNMVYENIHREGNS